MTLAHLCGKIALQISSVSIATPNPETLDGILSDEERLHRCYRLRHAYFVQERAWVGENEVAPGVECDRYDPHALHLGVWQGDEVAAYLRMVPFDGALGFMLDDELSALVSPEERAAMPRENAVEISRLVCRMGKSGEDGQGSSRLEDPRLVELLFKQLYRVSLERGFTRFYIVVEAGWLRLFARRFGVPFRPIGRPYRFPDGTRTVAATATLEELEAGMRCHDEAKYGWYREVNDVGLNGEEVDSGNAGESGREPDFSNSESQSERSRGS